MFELVLLSGVRAGAVIPITGTMTSGRSPDCQVEVPDPTASRIHARFVWDGVALRLVDNNSSNGCWVNEERISDNRLKHGDVVRFGETRMRVQQRTRRASSGRGGDSSSVFNLRDNQADLSNSLSISLADATMTSSLSAEALSARLDAILWVSEALASINQVHELYHPILETLFKIFPQVDRGFLLLGDALENLEPKAMRSRAEGATEGLTPSASICRAALERRAIVVYNEDQGADFDQGMSLVSLQIRSAMVVPLMVSGEILGLIVIDTPDRTQPFDVDDMGLAAAVCRQGAIALKNALLIEQVEQETKTRANLMRFLPKPVVDQAVAGEIDLALGGSACHGTVFFADVIGFTRISESLHPQEVVAMMNDLFNFTVPIIEQEDGAIDKFMGDAIMGLWGIPFDNGRSSLQAISAGLQMQTTLAIWNHLRKDSVWPQLHLGIGMSNGQLVAGNVGSQDRVEYTVLGNTVNTASRIQNLACRDQVLVSSALREPLGTSVNAISLPSVQVKNKEEPVAVYSVRAVEVANDELLMHLPVRIGDFQCWIIRRMADGAFVLLHENGQDLGGGEVTTDIIELPASSLGTAEVLSLLPEQQGDGGLRRSLISLTKALCGGLLSDQPPECLLAWQDMVRS